MVELEEIQPLKTVKKETRGRKPLAANMKWIPINNYYSINYVDENKTTDENNFATEIVEEIKNPTPPPSQDLPPVNEKDNELVEIAIDAENLALAEVFIDSIAQKLLNTIGFKINLNPMSDNDLEIWAKLAPPLRLARSWENFFKFYLIAKAKN